jgi:hypothetical protein
MLLNKEIYSFEEYFWTYNQSYKSIAEYRQELITGWDAKSCPKRTPVLAESGQQFLSKADTNSC